MYREVFNSLKGKIIPKLFPHVKETLETLSAMGCIITVASSRGADSLHDFLREMGIAASISYVLGAEDVQLPKPHPEPVLKTLADLGYQPSETLVVGDMPVDIQMGAAAGARTCAVTYGNASRTALALAGGIAQVRERLQDRLGMGLGVGDAVRAEDIRNVRLDAHLAEEFLQGTVAAGRGDREHVARFLQSSQRFLHVREQLGYQQLAVLLKDSPIGLRAEGHVILADARQQLLEPLLQGQADGGGDGLLVLRGKTQLSERLRHREHDVRPRIAEGTIKIQYD